MLTVTKLQTYEKFDGSIDGWALSAMHDDQSNMIDDDWYVISDLIQGLSIVANGFASPAFAQQVESKLVASTADDATRDLLRTLADRRRLNNAAHPHSEGTP